MIDPNLDTTEDGAPEVPAIGELIAQKYRVDSVVGTGGMGVVVAATHVGLGQSVAIKILTLPEDNARRDEARERFLREGRATAALVSDHVVRVYDVGTLDTGAPFMVMELLRGKDLAVALQLQGALPVDHAADYVRQAAEAIACAHAQGIVHRDLKPSNLFLTQRSDGAPLIKVLDFGISKTTHGGADLVTGNLTVARSVLGTPFYMSPEQIRDAKQVDFRTDIWALGLILHELLTGSPAFEGSTLPGVCAAIAADPPAALRLKRPEVPVELEAVVLKCLEKDVSKRFQNVKDLIDVLGPFCGRTESGLRLPLSDRTVRSSPLTLGLSERQHGETVSVPPSSDGGTMASARLGQSDIMPPATHASPTLPGLQTLSAAPLTAPPLRQGEPRPSTGGRSIWLVGVGLAALLALGLVVRRGSSGSAPSVAPSTVVTPPPAAPVATLANPSFALEIAASQPGAQVFEGESLLGSAPLRMSIEAASVARAPRIFSVRKPGYAPYTIVQGPLQSDARVQCELVAEPAPSMPAAAQSRPKPPAHARAPNPKPKPPSAPSDIFMQR